MNNYSIKHINLHTGRVELHDMLQLTGCEVSCNTLSQGTSVPFPRRVFSGAREHAAAFFQGTGVAECAICLKDFVKVV